MRIRTNNVTSFYQDTEIVMTRLGNVTIIMIIIIIIIIMIIIIIIIMIIIIIIIIIITEKTAH